MAGIIQLIIAAANFLLPQKLQYDQHLPKMPDILRQIFIIHSIYIVLVLLGFSGLCLFFAPELIYGSPLGKFLACWMAIFWMPRAFIQIFYYSPEIKRQNRFANAAFTLSFFYLGGVFSIAAIGAMK